MAVNWKSLLSLCLFLFVAGVEARPGDDKEYAVSKIAPALREGADGVVRKNITRLEVKNERKAYYKHYAAITIFTKDARDNGEVLLHYDKFKELEDFDMKLYDAEGNLIRSLESDNVKDYSATDNYTLYDDARVKYAELYNDKYPYTVEVTYTFYMKGYLDWPDWYTRLSRYPVENSEFSVLIPSDLKLRYWTNADTLKPTITQDGSKMLYSWKVSNLPLLSKDAFGEDVEDLGPIVLIAPDRFEIDDHEGSMGNWEAFGKWNYDLYRDRDKLPDGAKRDVHAIADPIAVPRIVVERLYKYMQNRCRYVSIQLGIGGWQPFDATFVHERGYGDCKALANYMCALLKEAQIPAYPVVIKAGQHRYKFISDFPSNQFNHVIVCVPLQNDTMWLECTSNANPPGLLGDFTENRGALMLTPAGGKIVFTPATHASDNLQTRHATVHLFASQVATAEIGIDWRGDQEVDVTGTLNNESPEEQRKWVSASLHLPNFEGLDYQFTGLDKHDTVLQLQIKVNLPRFYSQAGDRIFFQPNLSSKSTWVPADISNRLSPIRYSNPYCDVDSITYILPRGYAVEALPSEVNITSSFGSFSAKSVAQGDTAIQYIRKKEISVYEIPAKNYAEYRKFYADIVKADRAQAVLVRKQQ